MASQSALLGFTSSSIALAVSYPADTLSRQLQVSNRSLFNSFKDLKHQGVCGLYKGIGSALVTQPSYWTCYFPIYNSLKTHAKTNDVYIKHKWIGDMSIGFTAGAIASFVTNPLWVCRQRLQTRIVSTGTGVTNQGYINLCKSMYQEGGIPTFFRGTTITLVKNVQMALLLPLFERIKEHDVWEKTGLPAPISAGLSGAIAKIASSTGVYPLDVIRTNMRVKVGTNVTTISMIREIVFERPGGIRNLFRGIGWYWASSATMFSIMMSIQSLAK